MILLYYYYIKYIQWTYFLYNNKFFAFRCENKGANIAVEKRLQWISKARDLFSAQSATIQRIK